MLWPSSLAVLSQDVRTPGAALGVRGNFNSHNLAPFAQQRQPGKLMADTGRATWHSCSSLNSITEFSWNREPGAVPAGSGHRRVVREIRGAPAGQSHIIRAWQGDKEVLVFRQHLLLEQLFSISAREEAAGQIWLAGHLLDHMKLN